MPRKHENNCQNYPVSGFPTIKIKLPFAMVSRIRNFSLSNQDASSLVNHHRLFSQTNPCRENKKREIEQGNETCWHTTIMWKNLSQQSIECLLPGCFCRGLKNSSQTPLNNAQSNWRSGTKAHFNTTFASARRGCLFQCVVTVVGEKWRTVFSRWCEGVNGLFVDVM